MAHLKKTIRHRGRRCRGGRWLTKRGRGWTTYILVPSKGQSYKHFMLVNYDSRAVITSKLLIFMTLESQFTLVEALKDWLLHVLV